MNNLKSRREELGLTQLEVANKVGICESHYRKYELSLREPGVRTAIRIAKALKTTVEKLYLIEE